MCVLGGGGIATSILEMLAPFRAHTTVVRRRPIPMDGVDRVLGTEQIDEALVGADLVVLALRRDVIGTVRVDRGHRPTTALRAGRSRRTEPGLPTDVLTDLLQRAPQGEA